MIGLGLLAGVLAGGSLKGLKDIHFRLTWVLFVSVTVALLPVFVESIGTQRRLIELVGFLGVLIFLVVNIVTTRGETRAALLVIGIGWALNAIVIVANGGMPVSRWAYAASGQSEHIRQGFGSFYRVVIAGPKTKLLRLGDVIPIRVFREVVSIGDLFLMVGIALVIVAAMRSGARGRHAEQLAQ
jgi:hypothetical protein